jgi:hypothetical protein
MVIHRDGPDRPIFCNTPSCDTDSTFMLLCRAPAADAGYAGVLD